MGRKGCWQGEGQGLLEGRRVVWESALLGPHPSPVAAALLQDRCLLLRSPGLCQDSRLLGNSHGWRRLMVCSSFLL